MQKNDGGFFYVIFPIFMNYKRVILQKKYLFFQFKKAKHLYLIVVRFYS